MFYIVWDAMNCAVAGKVVYHCCDKNKTLHLIPKLIERIWVSNRLTLNLLICSIHCLCSDNHAIHFLRLIFNLKVPTQPVLWK